MNGFIAFILFWLAVYIVNWWAFEKSKDEWMRIYLYEKCKWWADRSKPR